MPVRLLRALRSKIHAPDSPNSHGDAADVEGRAVAEQRAGEAVQNAKPRMPVVPPAGPVRIARASAYQYRVPLKRPFSTSRHTTTRSMNILIELEVNGVVGIGEAAPRGKLTGDIRVRNWVMTRGLLALCDGATLDVSTREAALESVRKIYARLLLRAKHRSRDGNRTKPYRGLLSGFEIALLDLAARLRGESVADLLGRQRAEVYATATTSSTHHSPEDLVDTFVKHRARYAGYRCKGAADIEENLARLRAMDQVDGQVGSVGTHWLDLNEAMSPDTARTFVQALVAKLQETGGPDSKVVLEQPVPRGEEAVLAELQAMADTDLPRERGRIVIMADESLWDLQDYKAIAKAGGCGAINIKIPKVGGLLPALELAAYVQEHNPDTEIYVGGMIGTSDITARAIYNLVAALPRIDHCTTSPAQNVEANMAQTMIRFESASSGRVILGDDPGLGTDVNRPALETYLVRQESRFNADADGLGQPNLYDEPHLLGFDQKGLDNHLIEYECLKRGWRTERKGMYEFSAWDAEGRELPFFWSYVPALPFETRLLCRKKYLTKALFANFGVPVAEGRTFLVRHREAAIRYAHELGWPVVVKPGVGTGGLGVTANIDSDEQLEWALRQLVENERTRKRNDGYCIVERHVPGIELRVVVVDGRAVSAIQKLQASVVGDGQHTVAELVAQRAEARKDNPRLRNSTVTLRDKVVFELERQGLTPESVPEPGRKVTLALVASISQGADTRDVLDLLHPSVAKACEDAVRSVPFLEFGGVDILLEDFTRDISGQLAAVCEVNTTPSYSAAHFPSFGSARNVAEAVVAMYSGRYGLQPAGREDGQLAVAISCSHIEPTRERINRLRERAARFGLRGACTKGRDGIEILVRGEAAKVAAFASLCMPPPEGRSKAARVSTVPVPDDKVPDKAF